MKHTIIVVEDNEIVGYNKEAKKSIKQIGHNIINRRKSPVYALR